MQQWNQDTVRVDEVSTLEMVQMFNREDKKVAYAVEACLPEIAKAVDAAAGAVAKGGRLFYIGSGTGGKIGSMDATECPPTFGVEDGLVIALISGGQEALCGWREETEDYEELALQDLVEYRFSSKDILVALSASGNTPYVLAGVAYAKQQGAVTIGVSCSTGGKLEKKVDTAIVVDVGPEVIMGSTRLKAGTAQKMVLNMISSGVMIRIGKTYHNLMVDVRPINRKLQQRVVDIVKLATGENEEIVMQALEKAGGNTKTAIFMLLTGRNAEDAEFQIARQCGHLKRALEGKDDI